MVPNILAPRLWPVVADPGQVEGGFSESSISSSIRIDYVQHALAAIGHGRAALALTER